MQQAISYIRISTEDQSNWSISGQQKLNAEFARGRGIQIIEQYVDDGYSAKTFDRPGWKACIKYLKDHRNIAFLIITKYDRLIRNASRGLAMIERLENEYHIKVLSVQENFFIDPYSPYFFKMRADILVNGEFERRVISDRTKFGIWSARSQGRHIGPAPYGYINSRDEHDKPILTIDPDRSEIVCRIFDLYVGGDNFAEIRKKALEWGYTGTGRVAIKRMVSNPLYAGLVVVPTFKEKATDLVTGIHPPIITQRVWQAAQRRLRGKPGHGNKVFRDEVPFRGLIYCGVCGHICTGGESKGRKKRYWYYRCSHCSKSYNAARVNADITHIMHQLSISPDLRDMIITEARAIMQETLRDNSDRSTRLNSEIKILTGQRDSLETKYITDMISTDTYRRHHQALVSKLDLLESELEGLSMDHLSYLTELEANLATVHDLGTVFAAAEPKDQYLILRGCSMYGLVITGDLYTTPELNPTFSHIDLSDSKLRIDDSLISSGKMIISNRSTRHVTEYQTIFQIVRMLEA